MLFVIWFRHLTKELGQTIERIERRSGSEKSGEKKLYLYIRA